MIKSKCITYALLFVLSFIGSLGLYSSNASAASPFDDFDVVNKDLLYDVEGACDLKSQATNWYQGLTNNRFGRANFDAMMQDYHNWLGNGGGLTVASSGSYIVVTFIQDANQYGFNFQEVSGTRRLTLSTGNYNSSTPVWKAYLARTPSYQGCDTLYFQQAWKYTNGFAEILYTDAWPSYPSTTGVFISDAHRNYPIGYEGQLIPETWSPPEQLYPDYSWQLQKDENGNGILNVKYLANLPHFLTGTSHLVVEKMTDDWDALDENLGSLPATPGGWADWNFNIGDEAGYYMFRIDHNQQLDSPPWPSEHNYGIGQVYYQFFWDGHTSLAGSTVGCDGTICNQFTDADDYMQRYLHSLQVNSHGLTAIVTAPLAFIAGLPAAGSSCSPIVLPVPYIGNINLPCMKSYYEQHFGVPLAIYQAAVTAMFVYFVALGIFARIKDITNPKDDSIEAVKL